MLENLGGQRCFETETADSLQPVAPEHHIEEKFQQDTLAEIQTESIEPHGGHDPPQRLPRAEAGAVELADEVAARGMDLDILDVAQRQGVMLFQKA